VIRVYDSTGNVIERHEHAASTDPARFTGSRYGRDGRRFIILSDEKLSAFLELELKRFAALNG
jgi:hypothetical protein